MENFSELICDFLALTASTMYITNTTYGHCNTVINTSLSFPLFQHAIYDNTYADRRVMTASDWHVSGITPPFCNLFHSQSQSDIHTHLCSAFQSKLHHCLAQVLAWLDGCRWWMAYRLYNRKHQRVTGEDGNEVFTPQMAKLSVQFLSPFQGENRVSEW